GLQVFYLGFLADATAYEMGVPNVPLARLYSDEAWARYPQVQFRERATVQELAIEKGTVRGLRVNDETVTADAYVLAVPFERVQAIAPQLPIDLAPFSHSPITG